MFTFRSEGINRLTVILDCLYVERKKVIRKLNQVKHSLETAGDISKSGRKKLEKELLERRVDLNYVLVCLVLCCSERQLIPA
jgi:rRNA-processing protein Efg1